MDRQTLSDVVEKRTVRRCRGVTAALLESAFVQPSKFISCAMTSLVAEGGGLWSEEIFVPRGSPRL